MNFFRNLLLFIFIFSIFMLNVNASVSTQKTSAAFLSEPFLQLPTENSIRVVWFTEFKGTSHWVDYGNSFDNTAYAVTTTMSQMKEDEQSNIGEQSSNGHLYTQLTDRTVYRHEALVTGLSQGEKIPYKVSSVREDGFVATTKTYTLSAKPKAGTDLKILLTSDHQSKTMTPANTQKIVETIGDIDAVFFAGDLVNVPDTASQWFDDSNGVAFFPALQGRANKTIADVTYTGGEIIQNVPLYACVGNHEVMGRVSNTSTLGTQFNDPVPTLAAESLYEIQKNIINTTNNATNKEQWIKDNSYNTTSYEEIFTLPTSESGGELYYAETFGDIRLVTLYITRIWRSADLKGSKLGKYIEKIEDYNTPEKWGHGSFIFEPIKEGSEQYEWLKEELHSDEFKNAKYTIVMFHHQFHSLGGNVVPAYTDPVQIIEKDENSTITSIKYEYPLDLDYLANDLEPLLEEAGVNLVHNGHSHLWNRFKSEAGINFLETSNVGNTYGAYYEDTLRSGIPTGYEEIYVESGDPYGLDPIMPTIAPINSKPYISSNDITAFSILDTGKGIVESYYFDTTNPTSEVIKFDEFSIIN